MAEKEKRKDGLAILRERYVGDDPERNASVQSERVNAEVARLIYTLRTEAKLSQAELADLIGTTQSVISRLEDADYDGHSLSMLTRIAQALNQKLTVVMTAQDPDTATIRRSFRVFAQMTRRANGLTVLQMATRLGTTPEEILAMEQNPGYRPSPLLIHRLSKLSGVPERRLAELAGAIKQIPGPVREQASRFAAQSDSFTKLSKEERRVFDEFMQFLRTET
jgi:transcriptional regulator with XRE-family HTH domain